MGMQNLNIQITYCRIFIAIFRLTHTTSKKIKSNKNRYLRSGQHRVRCMKSPPDADYIMARTPRENRAGFLCDYLSAWAAVSNGVTTKTNVES